MSKIHYKIVQHDGGWAYKLGDVFSEPFATHDMTRSTPPSAWCMSSIFRARPSPSNIRMPTAPGTPSLPAASTGRTRT